MTTMWTVTWMVGESGAAVYVLRDKQAAYRLAANLALEYHNDIPQEHKKEFLEAYQRDYARCIEIYRAAVKGKEILEISECVVDRDTWIDSETIKYHLEELQAAIAPEEVTLVCEQKISRQEYLEVVHKVKDEAEGKQLAEILLRSEAGTKPKMLLEGKHILKEWS